MGKVVVNEVDTCKTATPKGKRQIEKKLIVLCLFSSMQSAVERLCDKTTWAGARLRDSSLKVRIFAFKVVILQSFVIFTSFVRANIALVLTIGWSPF